jgi:hypothetical protein
MFLFILYIFLHKRFDHFVFCYSMFFYIKFRYTIKKNLAINFVSILNMKILVRNI